MKTITRLSIIVLIFVMVSISYGVNDLRDYIDSCTSSISWVGGNCTKLYDKITNSFIVQDNTNIVTGVNFNFTLNETVYLSSSQFIYWSQTSGYKTVPNNFTIEQCFDSDCDLVAMYDNLNPTPSCTSGGSSVRYAENLSFSTTKPTNKVSVTVFAGDTTGCGGGADDSLALAEFNYSIDYIGTSPNNLPTGNFTISNKPCFNETTGQASILLNTNFTDSEGDTIYYSDNLVVNGAFFNHSIKYSKKIFIATVPEYTVLQNEYIDVSSCQITTDIGNPTLNRSSMVIVNSIPENTLKYMLRIRTQPFCSGSSFNYLLDDAYTTMFYETYFYGFEYVNQSVNITLWNSDKSQKQAQVELFRNATGNFFRTIQSSGFSDYEFLGTNESFKIRLETNFSDYKMSVRYTEYQTPDDFTTNLYTGYDMYDINLEPTNIIQISNKAEYDIIQDGFTWGGYTVGQTTPNFQTSKPVEVIVYNTGVYPLYIYVSDAFHIPSEYTLYKQYASVPVCSAVIPEGFTTSENIKIVRNSLRNSFTNICSGFNGISLTNRYDFDACNFVKYLVVFFSVVIGIIATTIFIYFAPNMSVGMGFIGASISLITGNLFIVEFSNTSKIIFSLIFAVGIVLSLLGMYGSSERVTA